MQSASQAPKILDLQDSVVYGPIHSRRFGESLGLNLLPISYKLCSFNCVYCQYGWTDNKNEKGEKLLRGQELLAIAAKEMAAFKAKNVAIDCITLAGNGEPTLHPDLKEIIIGLRDLRDRYYPAAEIGILSDSHAVHKKEVREALELLDQRIMKLDAGAPGLLERVNKPMAKLDWNAMLRGLKQLKGTILQSLFMTGSVDNTAPDMIRSWIETVRQIAPIEVQVYTVSRGTADPGIRKVSLKRLNEIASQLTESTGIPASVYE